MRTSAHSWPYVLDCSVSIFVAPCYSKSAPVVNEYLEDNRWSYRFLQVRVFSIECSKLQPFYCFLLIQSALDWFSLPTHTANEMLTRLNLNIRLHNWKIDFLKRLFTADQHSGWTWFPVPPAYNISNLIISVRSFCRVYKNIIFDFFQ